MGRYDACSKAGHEKAAAGLRQRRLYSHSRGDVSPRLMRPYRLPVKRMVGRCRVALTHGVIRFQHSRKISSIHIRDTVAPTAIRTTPGSCSLKDVNHRTPGVVMSIIPLDLQRRCEQRWAARFSRPIPSAAPRNQRLVKESLQIAAPTKSKEKPAGLKPQT